MKGFKENQCGFTFVELLFVMIIWALIIVAFVQVYATFRAGLALKETREKIVDLRSLTGIFLVSNGRYPCPAPRTLNYWDAEYGVERCDIQPPKNAAGSEWCDAVTQICWGRSAVAEDSGWKVAIGAVPIRTLIQGRNKPLDTGVDGWNNYFTYAVTPALMNFNTYEYNLGRIGLVNEFTKPTGSVNNDGHYVIVSHGVDGVGAYNRAGQENAPCPTTAPIPRDAENCNNTPRFMQSSLLFSAEGAMHYDDLVVAQVIKTSGLWAFIPDPTPENFGGPTDHVYNLNDGNVAVRLPDTPAANFVPQERLHVEGLLFVDGTARLHEWCSSPQDPPGTYEQFLACFGISPAAANWAQQCQQFDFNNDDVVDADDLSAFFDLQGQNVCFNVTTFMSDTGLICPGNTDVARAYSATTGLTCVPPAFPTSFTDRPCGDNNWVAGFRTNGTIICTNDPQL